MRTAQENLRLSAGQITKLTNDIKMMYNENQDMTKKLQELTEINKKIPESERKLASLSEEIDRLNTIVEKKNKDVGELVRRLTEAESMSVTINTLQQKVQGLINQNKTLDGDMKTAQ